MLVEAFGYSHGRSLLKGLTQLVDTACEDVIILQDIDNDNGRLR